MPSFVGVTRGQDLGIQEVVKNPLTLVRMSTVIIFIRNILYLIHKTVRCARREHAVQCSTHTHTRHSLSNPELIKTNNVKLIVRIG